MEQGRNQSERVKSAAAVALLHFLLGYAFLTGLGADFVPEAARPDPIFDLFEEEAPPPSIPPPPEQTRKATRRPKDPEGAAAPPNLKDTPTEIMAPEREIEIPVPPPITAAPIAGEGNEDSAGAAARPGPGTGRGGQGIGLGSGRYGAGTGGGGGGDGGRAVRARWLSGGIDPADYPRAAVTARASGTVGLHFVVAPNGRVESCRVTRSSGNAALDETSCRLIKRRFRYRPARNAAGRKIAETIIGAHEWQLGPEPPPIDVEPDVVDDDQ